ncbi:flagellar hook capping FlgD N-terminal domain-containing protein [Modestobacter lapidis]|nr:flagellar hook capping protein [Modestobacter lapidis]
MTSPISGSTPTTAPAATAEVTRSDQMGKDTFLKLLVAQMRFQDPSNPTSSSEFMAQTATFSQVEKLEEIASQNAELLTLQRSLSAGALVGKHVAYTADDGTTVTGAVSSVIVAHGTEPRAVIGDAAVPLGRITEITTPEVDTPGTGTPDPGTSDPDKGPSAA